MPVAVDIEPAPTRQALGGLAGWLLVWAFVAELLHVRQQLQLRAAQEDHRRRVEAERMCIARELNDVLDHHLSLISVQSGVALHLIDQQPEQARVALSVIKDASADALVELRSVIDMLRLAAEAHPGHPRPAWRISTTSSRGPWRPVCLFGPRSAAIWRVHPFLSIWSVIDSFRKH